MPRDEENYVALFIDWDNLAISTAVDYAGAIPDVRAIVRAAQRSGTVLIARAYAEWNVSSDRLSVYRAGVEPVYAPTFRFEPEPGSSVPRGKSLADPCLVTDCIDLLHLMPEVNVFVLVSGDKDLIPIVRLAQLRGRKVVVIGPDFVAAILREMADEYIPYRTLVEVADSAPTQEITSNGRGQRRGGGQVRATPVPPLNVGRSAPAQRQAPVPPAPRPVTSETNGSVAVEAAAPAAEVEVPPVETVAADEQIDAAPLWEMIGTIVRERENTGKPPLRATNLKDQLLARIPGFNERKYGFARFKDLLTAAEKANVIAVKQSGPVQFVSSPTRSAVAPASPAVPAAAPVAPPPADTAPVEPTPAVPPFVTEQPVAAPSTDEEVDASVVRFIVELRDRSRWLTYTYLLTNLLNHLGKGSADASADTAARATLNRLVQSGVLVVDREPREIDVNGTRHRVRLCHIVDDQPLVASIVAQLAAESRAEASSTTTAETTELPPAPTEATAPMWRSVESAPPPVGEFPAVTVGNGEASAVPVETSAEVSTPAPEISQSTPTWLVEAPVAPAPEEAPVSPAVANEAVTLEPESDAIAPIPVSVAAESVAATVAAEPGEPVEEAGPSEAAVLGNGHDTTMAAPLTLTESFAVLREVVREATGPSRPSTGPAAVKNRLVRRLGSFDERSYGFSKFKDYLLSAERAGAVRVEVAGSTARVSLPPE